MEDMILGIIIVGVIAMLVFTQIIPFAQGTMQEGSEPLPGMDAKLTFDALIGVAITLNTYTFATSMPRTGKAGSLGPKRARRTAGERYPSSRARSGKSSSSSSSRRTTSLSTDSSASEAARRSPDARP